MKPCRTMHCLGDLQQSGNARQIPLAGQSRIDVRRAPRGPPRPSAGGVRLPLTTLIFRRRQPCSGVLVPFRIFLVAAKQNLTIFVHPFSITRSRWGQSGSHAASVARRPEDPCGICWLGNALVSKIVRAQSLRRLLRPLLITSFGTAFAGVAVWSVAGMVAMGSSFASGSSRFLPKPQFYSVERMQARLSDEHARTGKAPRLLAVTARPVVAASLAAGGGKSARHPDVAGAPTRAAMQRASTPS